MLVEGQLIGAAAVWTTDERHRCGELGYSLNQRYWGRGYATEAEQLLLELGFGTLDCIASLPRARHEDHAFPRRVLEKAGSEL